MNQQDIEKIATSQASLSLESVARSVQESSLAARVIALREIQTQHFQHLMAEVAKTCPALVGFIDGDGI